MKTSSSPASNTRRDFMHTGVAGIITAGIAPLVLPARLLGENAPSKIPTLGFIGVGNHGHDYNLKNFLQLKGCHAAAVCDVFASRRARARKTVNEAYQSEDCRVFSDFRELLAQDDIDAVVISTPDHWHVPIALLALEAGKDVFCEKPTLTIAEGRTLVETVKKHNAVFQTGLEDRSLIPYYKLAQAVRNGAIGKLKHIEVGLPESEHVYKEKKQKPPSELDWNMWLGPAPMADYSPARVSSTGWRMIRDYSGGTLTDWGAHIVDTAQVANFAEKSGPVSVEGSGTIPDDAMNTAMKTFDINYTYANGVTMHVKSGGVRLKFTGSDGWCGNKGWRGGIDAHERTIFRAKYPDNQIWPRPPTEHQNFLDCLTSRKPTTYMPEDLHRLSTTLHLGNISMELGKKLQWDPKKESFSNQEANTLRSRPARDDWKT